MKLKQELVNKLGGNSDDAICPYCGSSNIEWEDCDADVYNYDCLDCGSFMSIVYKPYSVVGCYRHNKWEDDEKPVEPKEEELLIKSV